MHVRAQWRGNALMITDLYLHSADGITPPTVRSLSIRRLEAELTLLASPRPASLRDTPILSMVYHSAIDGDAPDTPEPSLAALRARRPLPLPTEQRPTLTRPDGTGSGEFYRHVAAAYTEYATATHAPAVNISIEADVPVRTVHRWIAEARRRGFLPAAKTGRPSR